MQHILILRELSVSETEYVSSFAGQKDVVILADPDLKGSYEFADQLEKLTEEEKKSVNYQALKDIIDFGDYIIDDQPVSKHLDFHGAGLWYYHKFRIYFKTRNQNYQIAEIEKNIKGASSVVLYHSNSVIDAGQLSVSDFKIVKAEENLKQKISIQSVVGYGFTVLFRFAKSLLSSSSKFRNKSVLCIDTVDQYRDILALDGIGTIFENAYLGYLYQKKGEDFGFIDQLLIPKFKGTDRFRFDKKALKNHNSRTRMYGEGIIGRAVLSIRGFKELSKIKRTLKEKYSYLSKNLKSNKKTTRILDEFISLHNTSVFYLFKFFAYSLFFQKNKFASIITTDENSPNFKIILDAAKKSGVFTIGYQHGSIHELHPAYIYSKTDIEQNPIPDYTITWGKKWANLLTSNGNYPLDRVGIAGQIRTDVIKNLSANKGINRNSIVGQSENMRIILFATQPQRDPALRCRAAEDVVKGCANIKDTLLVFKLHPRENDPEFYEQIAKANGLKNYMISKDEELYILLHLTDIVITCFSTVGSEALYFQKPLIILDHLKQDILHYYRDGVAWQATNAEELSHLIDEVLAGRLSIDKNNLQKYLTDSTYAIDGKVADRVWDYLNKGS